VTPAATLRSPGLERVGVVVLLSPLESPSVGERTASLVNRTQPPADDDGERQDAHARQDID